MPGKTISKPAATKQVSKRGPGRPRTADLPARHSHILVIAGEAFANLGYGGTTMDIVASRANISKETIYSRFPSKKDLFEAVVKSRIDQFLAHESASTANKPSGSLREALMHHVEVQVHATTSAQLSGLIRIVAAEHKAFPELAKGIFRWAYLAGVKAIVEDIQRFAILDDIPCNSPETVAEMLRFTVTGAINQASFDDSRLTKTAIKALADRIVTFLMKSRPFW